MSQAVYHVQVAADALGRLRTSRLLQSVGLAIAITLALSYPTFADPLDEPIKPLPATLNQDPARAEIGRWLFNDARLSANGSVSCANCHNLRKGGSDERDYSVGFGGKLTAVHAPTVLNAAFNFRQFWNGRAESLEAQIDDVVQNPVEMGSKWADIVGKVERDARYEAAFANAYKDGVNKANIENAIATYERTLITPNSRFDNYLRGNESAISEVEKAGYVKFKQFGCIACHQGVNVGGNMFQKFGVMGDYFGDRGKLTTADLGRYLVTGEEGDKYVFKVPSLRNVALIAPYFHDASAKTLDAAVAVMFKYQLGRVASTEDRAAIIKFLNTLTAEIPP